MWVEVPRLEGVGLDAGNAPGMAVGAGTAVHICLLPF